MGHLLAREAIICSAPEEDAFLERTCAVPDRSGAKLTSLHRGDNVVLLITTVIVVPEWRWLV